MSDTPLLPSKRLKTEDITISTAPSHMSHASSYLSPSHFQPTYHSGYAPSQSPFSYPQQSYVSHQMPLGQPGQQVTSHFSQHMPQTLQSYHQPPPVSPSTSRKRGAGEMESSSMGSNAAMTPLSAYSLSSQGMMGAPGPSGATGTGLGINTVPSQSMEHDARHSTQQAMEAPAPIKKGRTNTPWTPAEEQRLKYMREAGNSWSEIAKTFPNRTEGSVKKHWYKDMHYADLADDEGSFKQALVAAIKDYEQSKWKVIGQKVGKPAKACEQFAREHLNKG